MTPEITIIISVGPKFPTSESHSFQFFKQNSSRPDFDAASPWEPFGKFNVVATGGTVKVPPSGPQTGHATLRSTSLSRRPAHLCDLATNQNQRTHTYERPLGRPDIAVHSWFSPGRQGLRITLILLINITITEMNDDGTFCMECSKIKLADDPSPLPSHPHFAPTVSVAVSFVVVVVVVVADSL